MHSNSTRLRRKEAAEYLTEDLGIPCSVATLTKYAWKGSPQGRGPKFRKFGNVPLYDMADLKEWAETRLSKLITTTSELSLEDL